MPYVRSALDYRGVMVVAAAGGYYQLLYSRNSPEMSRICRVAGRKTLQRRPCLQLAAAGGRYLAGRHHDGGRIRYLRMLLVLVPPVLKGQSDAGQADSHKYDDEDAPCGIRCKFGDENCTVSSLVMRTVLCLV